MEKFKPKIILSAAISIDGKIANNSGESNLSSKKDLIRLHKLRSKMDAILVGKKTVIIDDPELTVRYAKGKNPIRIILDSSGIIPNKSKILQSSDKIKTIIVVSQKIQKKNLQRLKKFPVELLIIGKNKVNINSLLKKLSQKKIKLILLEGGGTLNWEFVKRNLIDEYFVTITPFVLGGKNSIGLVEGKGFDKIAESPKISLKSVKRVENDLVLHYVKV